MVLVLRDADRFNKPDVASSSCPGPARCDSKASKVGRPWPETEWQLTDFWTSFPVSFSQSQQPE